MNNRPPDFEAEVRFLTREEGGRSGALGPPRQDYLNNIHWDDDPSDLLWTIWPKFLDEHGQELPKGAEVPSVSRAHFYVIHAELKEIIHRDWLRVGTGFHICEGPRRVAACRVTTIFHPHETA